METGTLAAARGGFTRVCAMPNLDPVPDNREHLNAQLARIRAGAKVRVSPYGAITRGGKGRGAGRHGGHGSLRGRAFPTMGAACSARK